MTAPFHFPRASMGPTSPSSRIALVAALTGLLLSGCQGTSESSTGHAPRVPPGSDPRNSSYVLDDTSVTLVDGVAEVQAAPGSSGKEITRIWGEPTVGDLNEDGVDDALLILTRQTGGSGTFFYLVAAVASPQGYSGTTGLLLGDRIKPNSVSVRDGKATLSYMTRSADQSFAEQPTIEKIRHLILSTDRRHLIEVAPAFEGEADSDRMRLPMKTWTWLKTVYNNDTEKRPAQKGAFTLTFTQDTVQGRTDCNSFRGGYTEKDRQIHFDDRMAMTRMFCADSQEAEFLQMLQNVNSYFFTSNGQLILELKYDSGSMIFR